VEVWRGLEECWLVRVCKCGVNVSERMSGGVDGRRGWKSVGL